jgi:hypothetical protein
MNLAHPADDLFLGTSLLRFVKGTDTWPLDLNLIWRVGRRRELVDHKGCEASATQCATDTQVGLGYGITATFDASSLLSDALKKLAGS